MSLTKEQKQKIKEIEKDIVQGEKLWQEIKKTPKHDKVYLKELKDLLKIHQVKKGKIDPKLKKLAQKVFGGLEPPKKA